MAPERGPPRGPPPGPPPSGGSSRLAIQRRYTGPAPVVAIDHRRIDGHNVGHLAFGDAQCAAVREPADQPAGRLRRRSQPVADQVDAGRVEQQLQRCEHHLVADERFQTTRHQRRWRTQRERAGVGAAKWTASRAATVHGRRQLQLQHRLLDRDFVEQRADQRARRQQRPSYARRVDQRTLRQWPDGRQRRLRELKPNSGHRHTAVQQPGLERQRLPEHERDTSALQAFPVGPGGASGQWDAPRPKVRTPPRYWPSLTLGAAGWFRRGTRRPLRCAMEVRPSLLRSAQP